MSESEQLQADWESYFRDTAVNTPVRPKGMNKTRERNIINTAKWIVYYEKKGAK